MIYIRQSPDACIAYSLLQIGAVSKAAVREYEKTIKNGGPNWRNVGNWLLKHVPSVGGYMMIYGGCVPNRNIKKLPPGRGFIVIDHGINHAISYADGMVLDPAPSAPGYPETLSQLRARYKKAGDDFVVLNAYEV